MFYAAFPPEFNSGRMYTGPGSGSMRAAAAAWDGLATELQSTLSAYSSVISTLTSGDWVGPSSLAMAAAVTPYLSWMQATAAQAAEAATQATAAATAYETAFAAHVPPTEVAANRSQLASLVATNTFGQNTPAIAATEIQYAEMWAQDALAMDGYTGSSAAATNVTPFTPAPQITNGAGLAAQAAAVGQAASTSAGSAQSVLTAATSFINQVTKTLANLGTSINDTGNDLLNSLFGAGAAALYTDVYNVIKVPLSLTTGFNDIGLLINLPVSQFLKFAPKPVGAWCAPQRRAGSRACTALAPGHAVQCRTGRHGKCRHTGGKVVCPAELGRQHPGDQNGRLRIVGRRARSGAGGRARRREPVQFHVHGGNARCRHGLRGSHRCGPCRRPRPHQAAQRPQGRPLAGETTAPGRTNIGKTRKRATPHVDQDGLDSLLEQLAKKPGIHAVHLSKGDKAKVVPSEA